MASWAQRFLTQLPPVHHNVLVYIVSFLREVLKHTYQNRLNAESLAAIFANCLCQSSRAAGRGEADPSVASLQHLLEYFLSAS